MEDVDSLNLPASVRFPGLLGSTSAPPPSNLVSQVKWLTNAFQHDPMRLGEPTRRLAFSAEMAAFLLAGRLGSHLT